MGQMGADTTNSLGNTVGMDELDQGAGFQLYDTLVVRFCNWDLSTKPWESWT